VDRHAVSRRPASGYSWEKIGMRLAPALICLAACGVSATGKADPPRTVLDPWSEGQRQVTSELIDPWAKSKLRPTTTPEVVDPWQPKPAVPTAVFPVVTPVLAPIVRDPWARTPAKSIRKPAVPTARFPLVEVIDPWQRR
jgi:hypothetical protein